MKEVFVNEKTLPLAYHAALLALEQHGKVATCKDYNQMQKEISATMVIDSPLCEPMISRLYIGGFRELQQYVMEVLDGILDFKINASENAWEYTYHNRITAYPKNFNQLDFVIQELKRSPDSRRAVIDIRDNSIDPFVPHPACLQHMQFLIRDNKLHMKCLMRSNDAPEATFMNAFAFILLQKRVAFKLGIEMGSYTHRANSFHCYEKDFGLLKQYVDGIKLKDHDDITYNYTEFYKELMEEQIEDILMSVKALQNAVN